jgi:hypothetical protein
MTLTQIEGERKRLAGRKSILSVMLAAPMLWGACGATVPPPTQRMADAESAERSAREVGANNEPAAQLSLKLAEEQIAQAKTAMAADDNAKADSLLVRAKADAELAIAQAREKNAHLAKEEAVKDSATQNTMNANQGALK